MDNIGKFIANVLRHKLSSANIELDTTDGRLSAQ